MNSFVIHILQDIKVHNRKECDVFLKESLILVTYVKKTNIYFLNLLHNLPFNQPIPLYF